MSRSNRDAAAEPEAAATPRGDPFPEVPYLWTVRAESTPAGVSGLMRTVDPGPGVGADRREEFEPPYLVECAAALIEQMEAASGEEISGEDSRTRLGSIETRNCVTGEPGLIARRLLEPGRYSGPLAEILVPAGEFEKYRRDAFYCLGRNLSKGRLRIVLYRGEDETGARPAAFAVVVDHEGPERLRLLARLLVTPFEISQWWEPSLEAQCETAH